MVFIESGVRINTHYYIENVLKLVVKVHAERMYPNRNWTFQQDSASKVYLLYNHNNIDANDQNYINPNNVILQAKTNFF